jgi:hypothetical protein
MTRILILLGACSLLLVSGLTQGFWTGRWEVSHAIEEAVARLDTVPLVVGDWKGTVQEIPQAEIAGARVNGHLACHFENRRKGQAVNVLLVCGRPGVVSVHTPDICYRGAGYEMKTGPDPFTLDGAETETASLQTATFSKGNATGSRDLRIFWAWNAAGRWQAPNNPRWTFARSSVLYKLYVVRERGSKDASRPERDPAIDFMKQFLPDLNRVLFPTLSAE